MASRWTRALEYALSEQTPISELGKYFKSSGGVAVCARRAAFESQGGRRIGKPGADLPTILRHSPQCDEHEASSVVLAGTPHKLTNLAIFG